MPLRAADHLSGPTPTVVGSPTVVGTVVGWVLLVVLGLGPVAAEAREQAVAGEKATAVQTISLDVQRVNIGRVLEHIGRASGRNVVVLDGVTGRVTLKLKDVPWPQALDLVLASRGFGAEVSERVLLIADLPTLQKIRADRERSADWEAEIASRPPLAAKIFTPRYAPVAEVKAELERVRSWPGRLTTADRESQVMEYPEIVDVMTKIFASLDRDQPPPSA